MMTINKLNKILSAQIANGNGRRTVYVSKTTFANPLEEDGATILGVEDAEIESFCMLGEDGFPLINADGSERTKTALVLSGRM